MQDLTFQELQGIACGAPRLAYWLCRAERIWTMYQLVATWVTGAQNQPPISTSLPKPIGCDFYVRDMAFTIRRPNAFKGSVFKAQSDAENMFDSGINVRLTVDGCPKYTITDDAMPIELVARPATLADSCCISFPLTATQVLRAIFTLSRNLDPGQANPCSAVVIAPSTLATVTPPTPPNVIVPAGASLPLGSFNINSAGNVIVAAGYSITFTGGLPPGPFTGGQTINPLNVASICPPCPDASSGSGEIPTTVILVLRGYMLPCSMYGGISVEEAVDDLRGRGILAR